MSPRTLRVTLPALADPAVFQVADRSILTADGSALLTYDSATRSGFIYHIESGKWLIQAPVDVLDFAWFARMSGYSLNAGEDARRWLQACSANPVGGDVAPFPSGARH